MRTLRTCGNRSKSWEWELGSSALSRLEVFEIVARLDALGAPQRGVIEARPGIDERRVVHLHWRALAGVEARFGLARAVAFELVEGVQGGDRIRQFVDFAAYPAVSGGHCGGIDAKIEQRRRNASTASELQMLIDTQAPCPVEGRHQRPVEKHEFHLGLG